MKDQLKVGIVLNYITIGLNALVAILYTPYMLRMMGQGEYGLYSLVSSIIAYLTILDFGFGNAIIRYTAKMRAEHKVEDQYRMFGMFLWMYIVIGILALLLGVALYSNLDRFFDATLTVEEISRARIMVIMLIFNLAVTFPLSVFGAVIQAYEHFIIAKSTHIVRVVVTTAVMIVLLHYGYKAVAMVAVQTIMNVTILLFNAFYAFKYLKIKIIFGKVDQSLLREVAYYSFWIFLMAIVDNLFWNTGQFVLGAIIGTVAVAVYAVAIQLHSMQEQFSTAMSSLFLPRITAMVSNNNDDEKGLSDLFIKVGRLQYIVLSFVLVAFIVYGKLFVQLWAGESYHDAYCITVLFFAATTIPLCQNMGIIILQARNQMKFRALCYCFTSALCVVLQLVLVHIWGGIGCAAALAIAILVGHIIVMNYYYYKKQKLDIPRFWIDLLKMSIFPCVFGVISYFLTSNYSFGDNWLTFICETAVFSLIYFPLAYYFQFSITERELVKSLLLYGKNIRLARGEK